MDQSVGMQQQTGGAVALPGALSAAQQEVQGRPWKPQDMHDAEQLQIRGDKWQSYNDDVAAMHAASVREVERLRGVVAALEQAAADKDVARQV